MPEQKAPVKKEVVICSYGLKPEHITLETIIELKSCEKVFIVPREEEATGFLKKYCRNAQYISKLNSHEQARIISNALSDYSKVGVLVYGNPAFLCSLTDTVRNFLKDENVNVKAFGAISSFDALLTLLNDRNILRSYRAEFYIFGFLEWLENGLEFQPSTANIVCELCYLLEPRYAVFAGKFLSGLEKQYPGNHEIYLIQCATGHSDDEFSVLKVCEFKNAFHKVTLKTTMFIPPLKK